MTFLQEAIYEGRNFHLKTYLGTKINAKKELEQLKKAAEKGAFQCPYCSRELIIKTGEIREEHFSHRHSKSCLESVASDVYQQQIKRESKKHSSIKEIIFDELKTQEKINNELEVDYGFIKKAKENWRYYPDIILKNKDHEIAITILTNVTANKDNTFVKQIKKRNTYYKNKNMKPIWFVEDAELSINFEHHVIHLWEAELDLAVKTEEDLIWEDTLNELDLNYSIYELFNYYHASLPKSYDVRSVYYVHSTDTNIVFTVHRFILDEINYPFRAFAINNGYQISLSKALWTTETIQLSDPNIETENRANFIKLAKEKELEKLEFENQRVQKYSAESENNEAKKAITQSEITVNTVFLKEQYFQKHNMTGCTTYEELLDRHLEDLKKVRIMEEKIPRGLKKDWDSIQDIVLLAKEGKPFDYSRFKLLLENLKIPLRLK
jgi:hypothetical protein